MKLHAVGLVLTKNFTRPREGVHQGNELLPKHIVSTLRLDYIGGAADQVEGFQIFGDLGRRGKLPFPFLMIWLYIAGEDYEI